MKETAFRAAVGDRVCGFRVIKTEQVATIQATVYTFVHEKTGAELLYSAREDDNKTFAIAFQTLPEDDTGVFHILEHCVLNGSDKYPVKEPFVSMLQSSLQTFLNAMTYNDKTVYPVSSRNQQDFMNLMSVYLDAVFHPSIYHKPEIFMQEGWHYDMPSADEAPTYNGVVFSEMKGAFSTANGLMQDHTLSMLFPDTAYRYISGGAPECIPDLTYEAFLEAHRRFYHPSNAKIFLDGKLDVEAALSYIDGEYLCHYDRREPSFCLTEQVPIKTERSIVYPAAEDEEALAHLSLGKILCRFDEVETVFAAHILCDYLTGTNESPLKRAVLESGLAQDMDAYLLDEIYQPAVCLQVRNIADNRFDEVKAVMQQAVQRLLNEGLDKTALSASLEHLAFACRERSEPYGVELCTDALASWLYGGDPTLYWETTSVLKALRSKVDGPYFENLLDEMFGDMEALSILTCLPSETKGSEDARREQKQIEERYARWSDSERAAIADGFARLTQWQQTPDTPEVLATLPQLQVADIEPLPPKTETEEVCIGGRKALKILKSNNGIAYVQLYFSITDLNEEELRLATVLTGLFADVATALHTASALQNDVKTLFGRLSASIETAADTADTAHCTPYFAVSCSMLSENADRAMALLTEILTTSCYDDTERIHESLRQYVYENKQTLIGNGRYFAMLKAAASFSAEGALKNHSGGVEFLDWFEAYTKAFEQDAAPAVAQLKTLHARLFQTNRMVLSINGSMPTAPLEALLAALPTGDTVPPRMAFPVVYDPKTVTPIPSSVSYCALAHHLGALGVPYTGAWTVLSVLMTYGYLWGEVRVQGGAYGTGMLVRMSGEMVCHSFRDPNPDHTLAAFRGLPQFLDEFCASGASLNDTIIGAISATEPLVSPFAECVRAFGRYLNDITYDDLCRVRQEILKTTVEDLKALAVTIQAVAENGAVCVVRGN